MRRLELIIVLGFAIMFVAGLTVGRSHPVNGSLPAVKSGDHFPTLGRQLNLTADQQQKMEGIWKESHAVSDKLHQAISEEGAARDAEIRNLLTAELLDKYEKIQRTHEAKVGDLRSAIGKEMQGTHEKIRAILTTAQRQKFDEMAKDHRRHGPPMPGGPGFGSHHYRYHGPDTATSRPETEPSH